MDDPIQVTLLKMQPRYSQTSCENATPSSDTSPLALRRSPPPGTEPLFNEILVIQTNTIQKHNLQN